MYLIQSLKGKGFSGYTVVLIFSFAIVLNGLVNNIIASLIQFFYWGFPPSNALPLPPGQWVN